MSRWRQAVALLFVAACTATGSVDTAQPTTTTSSETTTSMAATTTAPRTTTQVLQDLGGRLCPDSDFTCVTLEMPIDHFSPSDGGTVGVTFAVLPATGTSMGAFVTATGGPGASGIAVADSYTSVLDPAITASYDIVFFDQRGLAMSGGLTCPLAAGAYYRADVVTALGVDHDALSTATEDFVWSCVAEMGNPEILPYLGTDQAAADLEQFRETLGFEELILYGESYGTQLAQTYAADHGEHLTRMILDGTVDLTLDGFAFFEGQARAFGDTLRATLDYCPDDPVCADDMKGGARPAYDRLLALLVEEPMVGQFPLPDGTLADRSLGVGDLEVVASAQMYSEDDRMMFLRALAAYAGRNDLVPMLRLLYVDLGVDPGTEEILTDPTYSDGMYYAVECLDYSYPGPTAEARAEAFFAAGAGIEAMPLGSLFYGDFPCVYWPARNEDPARPEPLRAAGVPTVVLGATADPATPYQQGVAVSERLEEGYLITQSGGPHVIFGRGNPCPDEVVTDFILDGTPPVENECDGETVGYYTPLLPTGIEVFETAEDMFDAIETDIYYLPEYYWWDTVSDTDVGCSSGGTITFSAGDNGDVITLDRCALMPGVTLTGDGSHDWEQDVFSLDVSNGTEDCLYRYRRSGEDYVVDDDCTGDHFPG
jgi:pimeloyl-ACP methyl ester carboxylesterase